MIPTTIAEESLPRLVSDLNDLIAKCKDGEKGYRSAADDTEDIDLIGLFVRLASERGAFAAELQAVVAALGGEPRTSSSVAGALHRGWIDLKTALSKNDPHAVLAECERGEDEAVALYRKVLDTSPLSLPIRELVSAQYVSIKAAHDEIRTLRDHPGFKRSV